MTDQELRKLKRDELLQIMIAQSKRISVLKKRLEAAEKELASKDLIIKEAGSIAEAALKLNHIFEDAQAAADQYLHNVKRMTTGQTESSQAKSGQESEDPETESIVEDILLDEILNPDDSEE